METNYNNIPIGIPKSPPPKNTKKYVAVLIVVSVFATVFFFWQYNLIEKITYSLKPKLPSGVPQDFLPENVKLKSYQVQSDDDFLLMKGEEYRVGKTYEINKPRFEAVTEIVPIMEKNGWVVIAGTKQDDKKTILKMNNGKQTVFIEITEIDANKSSVVFVPVERK